MEMHAYIKLHVDLLFKSFVIISVIGIIYYASVLYIKDYVDSS